LLKSDTMFHSYPRHPSRVVALAIIVVAVASAAACNKHTGSESRRYAESGDRYMSANKLSEAAVEYRNALVKDPRAGDVRVKLGGTYLGLGDFPNALREFVRAADLLPDDVALQLRTGNLLLLARRFDDAKSVAEKILAAHPSEVNAQILLANTFAGLKDVDSAVTQIEEAIRIAPDRSGTYSNLGAMELSRGKRQAAEAAFKKAVELKPTSIAANLALGNFYWLTERAVLAEQSLTRALELDPRNALTNRALANFFLATNRLAQAEQPLRTVLEVTKTTEATLALQEYYLTMNREPEARAILQPLLNDSRTAATANVRLAALDYAGGHNAEAYAKLGTVLGKDPANLQALLVKASLLLSEGKTDEALACATTAAQRHPDAASAFFTVGRIETSRRQPDAAIAAYQEVLRLNPRATAAKLALGQLQLAQGRPDTSVGLAAEALSSEPTNANAQLLYVRGLLAQGELQRAEAELRQLTVRFPNAATVHTQTGMLLGRQNKLSAARAELTRALELDPNDFEAFGGLVALDLASRSFDHARARVDQKLASGAPTAALLSLAARTYAVSGDASSAERFLKRAIEVDNGYVAGYSALGQLYLSQGRLDAARTEFEAVSERSPKSVSAITMVGIILQTQGDLNGARERFERVLQMDPEAAVAANELAWIYSQHGGNLDVAMHLAQTAQKHLPGAPEVSDTLGFIYYKKNLMSLAVSTLKTSTEKAPNNPVYQYHLGLAYASAGDAVRARASLQKALTLKPDFDGAVQAKDLLASRDLR